MLRLAIVFTILAAPVHALSCMRPDAVRLYEAARDSPSFYTLVRGHMIGDVSVPGSSADGTIPDGTVMTSRVRIVGDALAANDFDTAFDEGVDLNVTCAGPWCGGGSGDETLFALLHTENGLQLWAEPCAPWQVPATETGIERLLSCHRSGICLPAS